ncbi:MAG TPA: exosortase H-associated membrane protein [Candidatus Sulfomarinibacteraceae bacterium]|nr:exosortase H-associated membrane protein [Candidatus Sulfomarinibacteraceae bacterium]
MSESVKLYRSFLKRLPLTLLVAMGLWLLIRPVLDTAVTGFAQLLIRSFEYPRVTRLVAEDHKAEVRRSDFRTDSGIPAIPLTENHFNTIVLLALFLAMPRPFSRRQLERLFMGWCVLYLTQTMNLFFHVKCLYALSLGEWSALNYSDFARNFYGFWRYFTDLPGRFSFPFLIWLGFNWDLVARLLGAGSGDDSQPKRRRAAAG